MKQGHDERLYRSRHPFAVPSICGIVRSTRGSMQRMMADPVDAVKQEHRRNLRILYSAGTLRLRRLQKISDDCGDAALP